MPLYEPFPLRYLLVIENARVTDYVADMFVFLESVLNRDSGRFQVKVMTLRKLISDVLFHGLIMWRKNNGTKTYTAFSSYCMVITIS